MKSAIQTEALFAAEISAQGCSARRDAQQYVDIASSRNAAMRPEMGFMR